MTTIEGRARVVIVDDSEDLRLLLRLTLEADGRFDVLGEAEDGQEALDVCGQENPDLLILDLAMPRMDGMTALEHLRARNPVVPVVVILSAYPANGWGEEARLAGANGYLQKGGDPSTLADSVYSAWATAA